MSWSHSRLAEGVTVCAAQTGQTEGGVLPPGVVTRGHPQPKRQAEHISLPSPEISLIPSGELSCSSSHHAGDVGHRSSIVPRCSGCSPWLWGKPRLAAKICTREGRRGSSSLLLLCHQLLLWAMTAHLHHSSPERSTGGGFSSFFPFTSTLLKLWFVQPVVLLPLQRTLTRTGKGSKKGSKDSSRLQDRQLRRDVSQVREISSATRRERTGPVLHQLAQCLVSGRRRTKPGGATCKTREGRAVCVRQGAELGKPFPQDIRMLKMYVNSRGAWSSTQKRNPLTSSKYTEP